MGSIPDSPGLGVSTTRRIPPVRTHAHQWSKDGLLGDSQPRAQSRATRTSALDLAQQAQLAACDYLGYNPRDLPNPIRQQQGVSSDTSRPVELHMHHFHHHYIGTPTGQFSQSRPRLKSSLSNGTLTSTAANELAITTSNLPPRKTNTNTAISSNFAAGFDTSSVESARLPFPRGPSSLFPMLHGRVSDRDTVQSPFQNFLRLKNESGNDIEQVAKLNQSRDERLDSKAMAEREGTDMGDEPPGGGLQSRITNDCEIALGRAKRPGCSKPVRCTRPLSCLSLSWSQDDDGNRDSSSDLDTSCLLSKSRTANGSAAKLTTCKEARTFLHRQSSCISPSDNSVSDDSNSSGAQVNASCKYEQREGRPLASANGIAECFTKPIALNADDSESSSLENDSACSSGKRSVQRSTLSCSTCTKIENPPIETPAISLARKTKPRFRRGRKRVPRKPRAGDVTRTNPSRMSIHLNTANQEMEGRSCEPEAKSVKAASEQAVDERPCRTFEEKPTYERYKDRTERPVEKSRAVGSIKHYQTPNTQTSSLVSAESPDLSWTTPIRSNRGIQQVYREAGKTGKNMLTLENLHDDDPCTPSANRSAPHNRLREAVEAAWKTNLGSKSDVDNHDMKGTSDNGCWVVHKYHDSSKYHVVKDDSRRRVLKSKPSISPTVEEKVRGYEEAWKASLGTKKTREDGYRKDWADPVFENIHREQEDLKALIAREATLQRQLKDQTEARVAAEAKARVIAEHKAQLCAASAKAAEDGLRVLLDERAQFHSKFQEELQQGATDRSRLQDLLQLEKLKLEATEGELREVRKSFQDALAGGSLALPSKAVREDKMLDTVPLHALEHHATGTEHNKSRRHLIAESEGRIAAEARASYFQASAKAAEERLRDVLDERTWYYNKFKEELENNNTDMMKLRQLVEQEKADAECADTMPKMKVDTRKLVASSVADSSLDLKNEDARVPTSISEVQIQGSCCYKVEQEQEQEQDTPDVKDSHPQVGKGRSESKAFAPNSCVRSRKRNEKKRPLSPQNNSRDYSNSELDGNMFVKFDRSGVFGGEATATVEISPSTHDKISPSTCQFADNSCFPRGLPVDCTFTANGLVDIKEEPSMTRRSPRQAQDRCVELSDIVASQIATLPSEWKKETKAELRRIMQQQEVIWKIAEDAVDELGRRLELLERYKMDIQDTLGQSKATAGNMDCFFTRLEEKLEDFPRGFNSFYNSPVYEGRRISPCSPPTDEDPQTQTDPNGQAPQCWCIASASPNASKDDQIQRLKAEIDQLKDELHRRERKSDFQSLMRLPRSSDVPTPPPTRLTLDLPAYSRRDSAVMTTREHYCRPKRVSDENKVTLEVTGKETESDLPDDPFEEMKTVTVQSTESGKRGYAGYELSTKVCFQQPDRDMDSRSWVPTPDEGASEEMSASISGQWADRRGQKLICGERYFQDNSRNTPGHRNSNEGDIQVLKAAVQRMSNIFWQQEGKVQKLRDAGPKIADSSQISDLRSVYFEILNGMSQQLGELCRDLKASAQPHEKLLQRCQCMDIMDENAGIVESGDRSMAQLEMKVGGDLMNMTTHLQLREKPLFKDAAVYVDETTTESKNLRAALKSTEQKLADELNASHVLTKKLESGAQHMTRIIEEHTAEIQRKDQSLAHAHKLNEELATELSHAETSLSELRLRYKNLVSNLEHQLEAARKEAVNLQDIVNELKVEIMRKESMVGTLQVEKQEQEVQLRDLQSQLTGIQSEKSAALEEKLELDKSLREVRDELDEKSTEAKELFKINDELLSYSETKTAEVKALCEAIGSLKQSLCENSDEVARWSEKARTFSNDVVEARREAETYRLRCADLRVKLEETENELFAREESIDRLTRHLSRTIEGQDVILVEKEQLVHSLNRAQYKEHRMDDQVRQSKIIIQELEEKINVMDEDISQTRLELSEMRAKGQEALAMEWHAGEMRSRVHQLEEEVMEKDGQITILKTVVPRKFDRRLDYDSTFEPPECSSTC